MRLNKEIKCRGKHFHYIASNSTPTHYLYISLYLWSVLTKLMYLLIPASVYGCSYIDEASGHQDKEHIGTMLHILESGSQRATYESTLDVFAFNDDPLMRLDSYMRVDDPDLNNVEMITQSGNKLMFLCANSRKDRYEWIGIDNYHALEDIYIDIENDTRKYPVLVGECTTEAGSGKTYTVEMNPLFSEIVLNSIRCDFMDKAYEGECIENPKIYLINVNARSPLSGMTERNPERFINLGFLNQDDLDLFAEPEMVSRELKEDIGIRTIKPEISLFCYPNTVKNDGIGTPYTRLVVEGSLKGKKYYWPININRPPHGDGGIERNCSYRYDITITGKGSDNPDKPITKENATIKMELAPWKEKKDYGILF